MHTRSRHKKNRRLGAAYALLSLAVIAMAAGVIIYKNQPKPPKTNGSNSAVTVQPAPSAVKPTASAVASYTVPGPNPKYIAIPAISVSQTPVLGLGLLASGAIATPNNLYETGWYKGSSVPGQPGAMFIYGHVSSWQAKGIFYNLKKLTPGASVTITSGANKTYVYKVVSSKIYPYNNVDMNTVLSPVDPKKPGLNLMTCTGNVIKGTNEFDERLVVFASLSA